MHTLLSRLYDALDLDYPEDDAKLVVDDDLHLYFNESPEGLEICCPFMALPQDMSILQQCLRLNYSSPVIFAIDADNLVLMALIRLPVDSTEDSLVAGMELLIDSVRRFDSGVG